MKKIIMMLYSAAIICNVTFAQKIAADKVPAEVIAAFKTKFPNVIKTKWEKEKTNEYEASFKLNDDKTSANFDKTGKWLETETDIKVTALPAAVQSALTKDFAGYKINEVSRIESIKYGKCFEAEIEKDKATFDVLYTPAGIMLSKTNAEEEIKSKKK